jgi:phage terminase Nu1 subunit (DNA packaging protein)
MRQPVIATVKGLADLLDCSTTRVRKLAAEGTIVKLGHDRYDRDASITAVIKRLRDRVERQGVADPANIAASARLRAAKTALLVARLERVAGQLVDAQEAREAWREIVRGTSAMVTGLGPKITAALPSLTATDRETIRQILSDGLQDCALERGYTLGRPVEADDEHDPPPAA